jgi:hypothetical protein
VNIEHFTFSNKFFVSLPLIQSNPMKLLLILALTTFAFSAHSQADTAKLVTHAKDNYKIDFPASWTFGIDSVGGKPVGFTIFSPRKVGEQRVYISLKVKDLKGRFSSLPYYVSDIVEKIQHTPLTYMDGEIFNSKKMKTGNTEYYIVNYGHTMGSYKMKVMGYYFFKDYKGYELTYHALTQVQFEKLKAAAEKILQSFKLAE